VYVYVGFIFNFKCIPFSYLVSSLMFMLSSLDRVPSQADAADNHVQ